MKKEKTYGKWSAYRTGEAAKLLGLTVHGFRDFISKNPQFRRKARDGHFLRFTRTDIKRIMNFRINANDPLHVQKHQVSIAHLRDCPYFLECYKLCGADKRRANNHRKQLERLKLEYEERMKLRKKASEERRKAVLGQDHAVTGQDEAISDESQKNKS